jgi:hypothetical protein
MLRSLAIVGLLTPCLLGADPSPVLQVVRVKPGEMKSVEMALGKPGAEFRPQGRHGRDGITVSGLMPVEGGGIKETPVQGEVKENHFTGRYLVTDDFTVVWSKEKPELEFHAGKDMKKGTTDLRIVYQSFGGGEHVAGFRVIVE